MPHEAIFLINSEILWIKSTRRTLCNEYQLLSARGGGCDGKYCTRSDTLETVLSSVLSKLLLRGRPSLLPRLYIFLQMMTEKASKHIVSLNDRLHGCWRFYLFFCGRGVLKALALSASWHNGCLFWTTALSKPRLSWGYGWSSWIVPTCCLHQFNTFTSILTTYLAYISLVRLI